jgi:hypothetical protein
MASIATARIKREFKEVVTSDEVFSFSNFILIEFE